MTCNLLLENGGNLLKEDGGRILLENCDELLHGKIIKETRPRRRGRIIVDTPPEEEAPPELVSKLEDHLTKLMERVAATQPIPDIQLELSAAEMRELLEEDDEEALILILALAID